MNKTSEQPSDAEDRGGVFADYEYYESNTLPPKTTGERVVEVFLGICLRDHRIEDGAKVLELKRGEEYTIGPENGGKCMVFSSYWTWVDSSLFGGVQPLRSPAAKESKP